MTRLKPRKVHRAARASSMAVSLMGCLVLLVAPPGVGQEATGQETEHALEKPLASKSLMLDATAVGELIVAVGERGHILVSRDAGNSWKQATVPTRAALTAVYFHDETLGWAVGHDAVIVRTRDGGETWERIHYAPEEERPFLEVWFRDARNGIALGAYGYFLKTSDAGDSWEPFDFAAGQELTEEEELYGYGADYHLNHIARSASGKLYIAAEAGNVYRSDDGGETWITLPSPYEGSFFGTLPLEGDSVLLFGLRGHLFRSEDAGETWQELDAGTEALLTDGLRLEDGTLVISGLAGTLLVSMDGGHTFTLRQQADRQGLVTVVAASDGNLVLVGEYGVNRLPVEALGVGAAP